MRTGSLLIVVNASKFEPGANYWITPHGRVDTVSTPTNMLYSHGQYAEEQYGLSRQQAVQKGYTRVNVGKEFNVEHNGELNPNAAQHLIPEIAAHIRRGGRAFINQKEVRRVSDMMPEKLEKQDA